jgi:ABC-type lipoprotein release transport system permease subunit
MNRAFNLNSLIVSLLSVVGLLLIHYFSSQQRVYEFSLLRANGLSLSQMLTMLASDGLLFIAIGMLIGTVIGYGLLWMMHTYLNLLLRQVDPGLALYEISIDWRAVVTQYAWLVLFYLLAILLSMLSLLRSGIHRVLRIGDE